MNLQDLIDPLLLRIVRGEVRELAAVLELLAAEPLFVPATEILEGKSKFRGAESLCAAVVTHGIGEKKFVPVFTCEEWLSNWAAGRDYQSLSIAGADLALALPEDVWLQINPGRNNSLDLTPDVVRELASLSPVRGADFKYAAQVQPGDSVLAELKQLFLEFPEVIEAYFVELEDDYGRSVLGLLLDRIEAERRFMLVHRIAGISQRHYKFASAVEVYDDLCLKSSSSWDLFSTIAPCYVRSDGAAKAVGINPDAKTNETGLRERLERIETPNGSEQPRADARESAENVARNRFLEKRKRGGFLRLFRANG